MTKLKEFIQRHAFILIILVALLVALTNYLVYPTLIKKQLQLVDVPVAKVSISSNEPITAEKVTTIQIDKTFLPDNVVTDKETLADKYVVNGFTIPANGFFYKEALTTQEVALGKTYSNLKEGEYAYTIELTDAYKQANIFKTNQYINIYYYEEFENELGVKSYIAGQLAENVKIADIIDDGTTKPKQQFIVLALEEDQVADFMLASQYGQLIPSLTWQSSSADFVPTTFYNINNLKAHLHEQSKVYNNTQQLQIENPTTSVEETSTANR